MEIAAQPSALLADHAYASINNPNNPIGAVSTATTYAQIYLTTGANAETYVYYSFDLSDIPQNAQITSVACRAKVYIGTTSTTYIAKREVQMFSGTTAKGSPSNISSAAQVLTLTTGTWTRQELSDCCIRIYVQRTASSPTTSRYARFYGADLTVIYTLPAIPPVLTVGTPSKTKISDETNFTRCTAVFSADMNLVKWEARAAKGTSVPARGVGELVEEGGILTVGENGTINVDYNELTNGDGKYMIAVYGHGENGYWSDGTYEEIPSPHILTGSITPTANTATLQIMSIGFTPKGGVLFWHPISMSGPFYTFLSSSDGILHESTGAGFVFDSGTSLVLGDNDITFNAKTSTGFRRNQKYDYVIWG